jgi:hypothetical protein
MKNNNPNNNTIENKSSYNNFVEHFQNYQSNTNASWSRERDIYQKSDFNKRKIILKEINQFDLKVRQR